MKYASVIIPLVLVGVLFLLGCIWVATRRDRDEGDEESVPELAEPAPKSKLGAPKPQLPIPAPAHTVPVPVPVGTPHSSSSSSSSADPPRYER
ncbi:unnamed protein product [Rhizoctonia solani]|uniref:Uncharacterized protein n=1 Tax=Rhizoctonia solani TaxID=456999 RepID=A0A8H3H5K7_9AGAM|nr:unnamed protein product [Rhizoctonia solani]